MAVLVEPRASDTLRTVTASRAVRMAAANRRASTTRDGCPAKTETSSTHAPEALVAGHHRGGSGGNRGALEGGCATAIESSSMSNRSRDQETSAIRRANSREAASSAKAPRAVAGKWRKRRVVRPERAVIGGRWRGRSRPRDRSRAARSSRSEQSASTGSPQRILEDT